MGLSIYNPNAGVVPAGGSADDRLKAPVRFATTAALAASTLVGSVLTANANGALAAQDGVTPVLGDAFLVTQDGAKNGIYTLTQLGSAGTPWVATRRSDADAANELPRGFIVDVIEGTTNGRRLFQHTTSGAITLGTTALTFDSVVGAASGVVSGGWQTVYEIDFTALPTQDLGSASGTKTVGGKTWTLSGAAAVGSCQITNGTGLTISKAGGTGGYAFFRTTLAALVAAADLLDGYGADWQIWYRLQGTNLGQASTGAQAMVDTGDAAVTSYQRLVTGFGASSSTALAKYANLWQSGIGVDPWYDKNVTAPATDATLREVFVHTLRGPGYWIAEEGVYGSGWPTRNALSHLVHAQFVQRVVAYATTNATRGANNVVPFAATLPDFSSFGIGFYTGTSTTATICSATLTHLRIMKR